MRSIPAVAADFVAAHEDLRLRAYRDSAGVQTLGFGHVDGVLAGDRCTRAQALGWLNDDLEIARAKLYGVLKESVIEALTENQWAALLSFVFNLGAGRDWTLWKRLNASQFDQAPGEMIRFVNAGGRKVQGLVNRRADEVKLWSTEEPGSSAATVSSSVTRDASTPPTPADPTPVRRSAPLLISAAGAVTAAAPMLDQVRRAIEPFSDHSEVVARLLGVLATAGAGLALIGLALMWLKHREMRS